MTSKHIKFVYCADVHGDKQDPKACDVVVEFCHKIFKPDMRILGGDAWNFASIRKGASDEERRESLEDDFTAGKAFINRYKPTHFPRGNHDERLWDLAAHGFGAAKDFAVRGVNEIEALMGKHHCLMLPYHKSEGVFKCGEVSFLHGFFCGISAARQTAQVYGTSVYGHCHDDDQQTAAAIERRTATCSGCMCDLDMEFEARRPSSMRHCRGFVFGVINPKTGRHLLWKAKEQDGKWFVPSDIQEL